MLNPPEWVEDLGGGNYYGAPDPMFEGPNGGGWAADSDDVQDLIDELLRRNSDMRGAAEDMADIAKAAMEMTPQNSVCEALTGRTLFDKKVSRAQRLLAAGLLGLGAFGSAAKAAKVGQTVLGKFPDYLKLAEDLGAKRFPLLHGTR